MGNSNKRSKKREKDNCAASGFRQPSTKPGNDAAPLAITAGPGHSRPQQESERRSTASGSQSRQPADPSLFQYKYTPSAAEAQPAYMPQLAIEAQGGSLGASSDVGGPTP